MSKPARAREPHRFADARGVVDAAEPPQLLVAQRLHADAQPVDAGGAVAGEALGRRRLGVHLERDFGVARVSANAVAAGGDEPRRPPRARAATACRRRSRSCRPAAPSAPRRISSIERVDVARPSAPRVEQAAVEVAVVADRAAERDVEVEAEHGVSRQSDVTVELTTTMCPLAPGFSVAAGSALRRSALVPRATARPLQLGAVVGGAGAGLTAGAAGQLAAERRAGAATQTARPFLADLPQARSSSAPPLSGSSR